MERLATKCLAKSGDLLIKEMWNREIMGQRPCCATSTLSIRFYACNTLTTSSKSGTTTGTNVSKQLRNLGLLSLLHRLTIIRSARRTAPFDFPIFPDGVRSRSLPPAPALCRPDVEALIFGSKDLFQSTWCENMSPTRWTQTISPERF